MDVSIIKRVSCLERVLLERNGRWQSIDRHDRQILSPADAIAKPVCGIRVRRDMQFAPKGLSFPVSETNLSVLGVIKKCL